MNSLFREVKNYRSLYSRFLCSMRLITPLIMIAFASTVQAQDVLEWSDKRKLTFADFRKKPDMELSHEQLILRYGVNTQLDSAVLPLLKNFNGQVSAVFYPDDSWIDKTNGTGLLYSNTIFDMYEWACRTFRKRLSEVDGPLTATQLKEISNEVNQDFSTILEAYDSESQYASNLLEQMKWESRINQELLALSAYCKSCTEPKIN
jgi:hypothetical protein